MITDFFLDVSFGFCALSRLGDLRNFSRLGRGLHSTFPGFCYTRQVPYTGSGVFTTSIAASAPPLSCFPMAIGHHMLIAAEDALHVGLTSLAAVHSSFKKVTLQRTRFTLKGKKDSFNIISKLFHLITKPWLAVFTSITSVKTQGSIVRTP